MSFSLGILGAAAGGYALMRSVGGFMQKITNRIFPFEGSIDEARALHQARLTSHQNDVNQKFQARLQESGFQNQKDLAYISGMLARQTTFLANIQNCQNALRSRLFDDALRNFPLNIPPIVMLQNAGISIGNLTDKVLDDDPLTKKVLSSISDEAIANGNVLEHFKKQMQANPVALSVFVTPLQMDSRVAAKDKISTIVWDNVYQQVESMFVNEYNRSGDRPVIFYPSAWNVNAKPGMHAAEILYFFTKGMPVVVVEPRFDGKRLRFMFSCWGVGMMGDNHIRQEIAFDVDWNDLILPAVYERSKRGLESLGKIEKMPPVLAEIHKRLKHNVEMYDMLQEANGLSHNDICDDLSKLFYLSNEDYKDISEMLSNSLGMVLSSLSDVHHLLSRGIEPLFPQIKDKYFGELFNKLNPDDLRELNESFAHLFKTANTELLLSDSLIDVDLEDMNKEIDNQFGIANSTKVTLENVGISERLDQETKAQKNAVVLKEETKICKWESINVPSVILNYCKEHNIEENTLSDCIKAIKDSGDEHFIRHIKELAEEQGDDNILQLIGNL